MPTGYTASIENGTISTGKDFLMLCTRAMGVSISMRDEPLSKPVPEQFEPDDYNLRGLKNAQEDLEKYSKMTLEEAAAIVDAEYEKKIKAAHEGIAKAKAQKARYEKVLSEVEAWNPPTDEHNGLKEFALDQIKISTKYDSIDFWQHELVQPKPTPSEWLESHKAMAIETIQRRRESIAKETSNIDSKNLWLKQLRDSLNNVST